MPAKRRLTPEDVLTFKNVSDAQIHPDGACVAFVVGDSFVEGSKWPKSNIWLVGTDGAPPRPWTGGPRTDSLPRWSPDGRWLAFLSDRLSDGKRQVFVAPCDGGEAIALTNVDGPIPSPRGLNSLQWSPDGRWLAFLMEDPLTPQECADRDAKDDAIVFERQPKYVRVWRVDLATRAVDCISPPGVQIWEFSIHPGSQELAAIVSDEPFEWAWYTNRVARFTLSGPPQTVWQTRRQAALPTWSPDGRRLAWIASNWSDRCCVAGDVWTGLATGGAAINLTEGLVASVGWIDWNSDGGDLLALAHERGGVGLYRLGADDGSRNSLWWREAAVTEAFWPRFTRAQNGDLAVVMETPSEPREVYVGRESHGELNWRRLTDLHPQAAELEIGETSVYHWSGADGWPMQGLLMKPPGYQPGVRAPMVTWVHGGPTGVSAARYYAAFGWCQLLAAQGYAVFLPNYRGSVGWGLEFAESNLGDMGGKDFQDVLLGIDSLVDSGVADSQRLAIAGWSYGGFAAAWAVSQTSRFKAAVMGAGISHWLSFHGRSSLSAWDAIHYQADPYEALGAFHRFSPLSYFKNLQTPTLILHGEADADVPVEQSYLFYRALKDKGAPTELVVYPREMHEVRERLHLLDMSRRVLRWMKQYL